ncbi:unnamed protein product [Onchocerca ochengi]|uniref:ABC transporter ATP-binding protein n=1 Tax=Onchocerca ochengi TaxID=42157 RepID=A0A182EBY3_ONCOC|nr:unnamed protein product [Onchocerca ochengi]
MNHTRLSRIEGVIQKFGLASAGGKLDFGKIPSPVLRKVESSLDWSFKSRTMERVKAVDQRLEALCSLSILSSTNRRPSL